MASGLQAACRSPAPISAFAAGEARAGTGAAYLYTAVCSARSHCSISRRPPPAVPSHAFPLYPALVGRCCCQCPGDTSLDPKTDSGAAAGRTVMLP